MAIDIIVPAVFLPIVATYITAVVVGWIVFYHGKNIAFKRWWWPRFVIGAGIVVGCSGVTGAVASRSLPALLALMLFMPALIAYLSWGVHWLITKSTFCDRWMRPTVPR